MAFYGNGLFIYFCSLDKKGRMACIAGDYRLKHSSKIENIAAGKEPAVIRESERRKKPEWKCG
jgi:hypothetical protein